MATSVSEEEPEEETPPAPQRSASELRRESERLRKNKAAIESESTTTDVSKSDEAAAEEPPRRPSFPKGRRPSSGTDIGFEESTSGSELEPAAPGDDTPDSSAAKPPRDSVVKRGSRAAAGGEDGRLDPGDGAAGPGGSERHKGSNAESFLKARESSLSKRGSGKGGGDDRPPRRQWGSARPSKGLVEGVDLENPEVKELLRRLSKTEESSSSSGGGITRLASPKPGEYHRGIKALHRAVQENELPMRMAYEQLDELAANAERVKFAIERNRSLLTLQVKKANERVLRVAFMAWSLETQWQKRKKLQLKRAHAWSQRSLLSRTFHAWRRLQIQGMKAMRLHASAAKILQRHKLHQVWKVWVAMARETARQNDEFKKEKRLRKDLDKKHRDVVGKRASKIMQRNRLRRYFRAFQEGMEAMRLAQDYLRQILIYLLKKLATRAFLAWRGVARKLAKQRAFLKARLRMRTLRKCLQAWRKLLDKDQQLRRSIHDIQTDRLLRPVFIAWREWVRGRRESRGRLRGSVVKLDRALLARAFHAFVEVVRERRRVRGVITRHLEKTNRRLLGRCFQAWISFMQMGAHKKMQNVQRFASAAERENEKLRTENERLSTIIDSGDWNKDRVAELVAVQQVLSGERVALTKLIGRLQRQHHLALEQQEQQELEIRNLKEQLLSEMLKRGTTPEVVYAVDNLAMDQVSVFPDGELHVKAVKPRNKGKWSSLLSTGGTTRTPSVLSNKPAGSPRLPHSPRTPLKPRAPDPTPSYRYLYT